ncbi:NAD(P)H:quinone oxidoreductase type IV [Alicyclobacillus acidocaldarius]|uniref:Flavoprotein WrbA n=1 Tax=Alicyclobacillus acidocaldarius subsp. acidocaldarius (strain ATCC 27009 / DSM 446 / BCRC 14685 / JCM 5260 / KCTC 1825 / NBRC 15652 / NCIMB 11725 / NRRL B-14509 / 104-IA) TaxID=521098 RepID=C8WW08_ALIAD|nr:NAD(P)H:quinone oxidoreductase type IV [Alicyclobacillus acidocaldarius]ACV58280.1 flavoprotein WrbA [Alicyclobacillus acidocaldarius subsp. acidocaldarius DSM 446]
MSNVHLTILYYSATGTNYRMAQIAAEAARELGAEVRVRKVAELAPREVIETSPAWKAHVEATAHVPVATPDDVAWADAVIFSVPSRFGNIPSQMKQFLDTLGPLWAKGLTANKVVSAMSSAQNPHGGQEATILSLYTSMYHWGAIIAAPGFTDASAYASGGNPYGTSVTLSENGEIDPGAQDAIRHQARRTVTIASWVKQGQAVTV